MSGDFYGHGFICARQNLQILPNGRISICENLNDEFLGLPPIVTDTPGQKIMPLREILSTCSDYMLLMDKKRQEFIAANPECTKCKYFRVCGGGWLERVTETVKRVRPQAKSQLHNDNSF